MSQQPSFRARLFASCAVVASAMSGPLHAQVTVPAEQVQQAEPTVTEQTDVVITGTRIARPDLETASPVNVIDNQEIQLRQPQTAEDLLRDLPSVRPSFGPGVNNGGDGSASVDLRGIGTNRTLVLLDGRRIVPFGLDGITDLNTIPVDLVERVDVVTGGASSVYGADAVAGVVNFVTKRNFSGIAASGSYRISARGDAPQAQVNLTLGTNFADGRGNVALGVGYTDRSPLLVTNRDYGVISLNSANGLFTGSANTIPVLFTSPGTVALGLGPNAQSAGAVLDVATGRLRLGTQSDFYNLNTDVYYVTPLKRYNVYASTHFQVSDAVDLYATAMVNRNEAAIQLASTGSFSPTYRLPLNNAFLPAGVQSQLCTAFALTATQCAAAATATTPASVGYREVPVIAQRRFVEFGPRGSPFDSTQYQAQVGVRGKLSSSLNYDVSAQYGETAQDQFRTNYGSFSRLQQALRAYRTSAGDPVCSDTSGGCVPFNLFGPLGSITPAMLNFIDLDPKVSRKTTLAVATASLSGDLFGLSSPLSTSPIAFSIGAEYRRLTAESMPDAPSQIAGEVLGTGTRQAADRGRIETKEVFGELIVPLIAQRPFFHSLQAEGGVRYSDYNTTGGSLTWKAGGTYEPVRGVKLRGMYQRAVRSPNILELFQSPVPQLGNLATDPCQGTLPLNNAPLTALCVATGAPASAIGSIPTPSSSQINQTTSGNPNLDVERASTLTFGGVIAPAALRGFSLTVDYYRIKVKDAITVPAPGDILNGCYSAALNPSFSYNAFCQLIARNPLNGSLNGAADTPGVILGGSNLGTIETSGIDVSASYRSSLERFFGSNAGAIRIGFTGTWLRYYHFQATPNSINRDCTGYYSTNCTNPRPKYKWNGRLSYENGPLELSLLWTHIGAVRLEPFLATVITPLTTPQPGGPNPVATTFVAGIPQNGVLESYRKIGARNYFDLSTRLRVSEKFDLRLLVENLLDKAPPLVGSNVGGTAFNSGNTFPTTYDVIGRAYTIGINLRW